MRKRATEGKSRTTRRPPAKAKGLGLAEDTEVVRERIAVRAYELYRARGARRGNAVADWLEAERQILGPQDPTA